MNKKIITLYSLAILLSAFAGFILAEVTYRAYLFYFDEIARPAIEASVKPSFQIASEVFTEFDPVAGNRIRPDLSYIRIIFEKGRIAACKPYRTNTQGQHSVLPTDESAAEQIILIVGDSMTSYVWDGETWPSLFRKKLSALTGRSTRVINLAVGGIGVRQMFDILARALEDEELPKPDLALAVFITDDLDRARSWKHVLKVNSHQYQIIRTYSSSYDPEDLTARLTSPLIDTRVTMEWCERAKDVGSDPLVQELIAFYQEAQRENHARRRAQAHPNWSSYVDPTRSFILNRIVHNNAYSGLVEPVGGLHKTAQDLQEDSKFIDVWKRISKAGVPVHILHMPIALELEKGKAYEPAAPHQELQLKALQALSTAQMPVHFLYEEMKALPSEKIAIMAISPQDQHPTRIGLGIYADAIADYVAEYLQ